MDSLYPGRSFYLEDQKMKLGFKYLGKVNIKTIDESLNKLNWEKFVYRQQTFDVHKHTQTVPLIFIVVMSIVCSIIAIYFYDRKLMREIAKYEKKMYKKKKGNG